MWLTKPDGSPRFCVDYRCAINKSITRKSWLMPDMEAHIDTVAAAKIINVCDTRSACRQTPEAEAEQDTTDFVTLIGKWVFSRLAFEIANAPFLFSRMMSLAFSHFGPKSGFLAYTRYGRLHMFINMGLSFDALRKYIRSDTSARSHPKAIKSSIRAPKSKINTWATYCQQMVSESVMTASKLVLLIYLNPRT